MSEFLPVFEFSFGTFLFLCFCFFSFVQLLFLVLVYSRLAFHKDKSSSTDTPPVTIVIAARNEADNLFKNLPYIEWKRRLHEKVEGAKTYVHLPSVYELSLLHNKTIEKQIQTNVKYNKMFTEEENKGFKV